MKILKSKYAISKSSTYDLIGFQILLQFDFKNLINIPKVKKKYVPPTNVSHLVKHGSFG
jgi:hypothetical protein